MNGTPKNPTQGPHVARGSAEHVLRAVHTIALLAESSATTRSDLYQAALVLKELNLQGMTALLEDLERRLADPALRADGGAVAVVPTADAAATEAQAGPSSKSSSPAAVAAVVQITSAPERTVKAKGSATEKRSSWLQRIFGFFDAAPMRILPDAAPAGKPMQPASASAASSRPGADSAKDRTRVASAPAERTGEAGAAAPKLHPEPSAPRVAEESVDKRKGGPGQVTDGPSSSPAGDASQQESGAAFFRPARPLPQETAAGPSQGLAASGQRNAAGPTAQPGPGSSSQQVVPAGLTTGRWDSGRRARLSGQSRIDPAPPSPRRYEAPLRTPNQANSGIRERDLRRAAPSPESELAHATPATGWIPRPAAAKAGDAGEATPAPLSRRWELLSRFDSGARVAARPDSGETGGKP